MYDNTVQLQQSPFFYGSVRRSGSELLPSIPKLISEETSFGHCLQGGTEHRWVLPRASLVQISWLQGGGVLQYFAGTESSCWFDRCLS